MAKQTPDNVKQISENMKPIQQIEISDEELLNLIVRSVDDVLSNETTNLEEFERQFEENNQIENLEDNEYQNIDIGRQLEEAENFLRRLNSNDND